MAEQKIKKQKLRDELTQTRAAFEEKLASQSGAAKEEAQSHTARLEKEQASRIRLASVKRTQPVGLSEL